jgi:MFS family permease
MSCATGSAVATGLLLLAVVIFGLGECRYDTVLGPLVADLAPAESRGRYMAVSGFSWQLGFIAGPGRLLLAAREWVWPAAATVCVAAGLGALALERSIPDRYRRTP